MIKRLAPAAIVLVGSIGLLPPAMAAMPEGDPEPGSPEYIARDIDNMERADGRQTAPDGRQNDPDYAAARDKAAAAGADDEDPYRVGTWNGIRGQFREITFTDTSSPSVATFSGRVHAPLDGAVHPDTGERLAPPYPGLVIVHGTNLSAGNFAWAAQDLAERGYVTLTFTVPPPQGAQRYFNAAKDAVDFFRSTPSAPAGKPDDAFNPYWELFDRRPQRTPSTPGRPYRFALAGHSIGAAVISALANMDERVSAVVGWDKLIKSNAYFVGGETAFNPGEWKPTVPALGVHSEYFFEPTPYPVACALPFGCEVHSPTQAPPPDRELSINYGGDDGWGIVAPQPGGWTVAGVDVMLLVLRSSTHSEYVDGPNTHASRYGKAVTSYYQTAWLDRYLKRDHTADRRLEAASFRWLEPRAHGVWKPTPELRRDEHLSIYFCSAWRYHTLRGALVDGMDPTGAGCAPSSAVASWVPATGESMTRPPANTARLRADLPPGCPSEAGCDESSQGTAITSSFGHAGTGTGDGRAAGNAPLALMSTNRGGGGDAAEGGSGELSEAWAWCLALVAAGALAVTADGVRRHRLRAKLGGGRVGRRDIAEVHPLTDRCR